MNSRCNKCKKLDHFARDCKTPQHVIQKMKGTKAHGKDSQVRDDCKSRVPKCELCNTKDCFHLRTARAAVASKKRGAHSGRERHNNRMKARVTIEDSDNSGDESNILVEDVIMASNEKGCINCACNKMILTSKEHMKNLQRVDKKKANKGKLKFKGIGEAGSFKGVYFAPEASKNLIDMKSIKDKNCTVTFDGDEVIIRDKASNKTFI